MFYQFLITIFFLATLNVIHGQEVPPELIQGLAGRIIGGEATTIQSIPFQVSFWNGTHHFCGGALLSDEWVITAAHCMGKMGPYQIRINSTTSNEGGTLLDVVSDHTHPYFNEAYSYDYDVAVVKVKKFDPIDLRFAKWPKCGADKCSHSAGNMIMASGWGENHIEDKIKKYILQRVRLPIVNLTDCKNIYQYDSEISNRMFCAGFLKEGGKDSCQGDSGGPATCKGDLVGVVSFGYECAKPGEPGIYTDLLDDGIQSWIEKMTGLNRKCGNKQEMIEPDVPVRKPPPIRVAQEALERE